MKDANADSSVDAQEADDKQQAAADAAAKRKERKRQRWLMDCLRMLDRGDALVFNALNRDRLLYVGEYKRWLEWGGQYWLSPSDKESRAAQYVEDVALAYQGEADRLEQEARDALDKAEKAKLTAIADQFAKRVNKLRQLRNVNTCVRMSLCVPTRLEAKAVDLDRDPYALCTPTGVVDIRSGECRPGTPGDLNTRHTQAPWKGMDAPAPKWRRMVREIMGDNDDTYDYFHKLCGVAICGRVVEKLFVILLGEGDSGKTTIFEILGGVLSGTEEDSKTGYSMEFPVNLLLDAGIVRDANASSPAIMALKGRRICWASEPGRRQRFSTEQIKLYTGGDTLTARDNYTDFISFNPSHTLFLITNFKLRADAADTAFWNRAKLIRCPYVFKDSPDPQDPLQKKRDPTLKEKILRTEGPGVLAWLVEGYQKYLASGRSLEEPEAVRRMTAEYRAEEDIIGMFLADSVQPKEHAMIRAGNLYDCFKNWYERNFSSKKAPNIKVFGEDLKRLGYEKKRYVGNVYYLGVEYTDAAIKEFHDAEVDYDD